MFDYYILKGHEPVKVTQQEYMDWYTDTGHVTSLRRDHVDKGKKTEIMVSTVFLMVASNWQGPPLLFETMVFGGKHNHYQRRYATWDEAIRGHEETLSMVKHERDT